MRKPPVCGLFVLIVACGLFAPIACDRSAPPPSMQKPSAAGSETRAAKPRETDTLIVAVGDSLTEGLNVDPQQAYPAQLEQRLRAEGHQVRVINAGISGETSRGALSRIDWILNLNPQVVILETGANDGLRGLDPELTQQNIEKTVATLQQNGVTVVVAGMRMVQNMGAAYAARFEKTYAAVAKKHEVIFMLFFLDGVAAEPKLNQADGIHPTAEGYAVIVERLLPFVLQALAK